jgi:hypothetical protein
MRQSEVRKVLILRHDGKLSESYRANGGIAAAVRLSDAQSHALYPGASTIWERLRTSRHLEERPWAMCAPGASPRGAQVTVFRQWRRLCRRNAVMNRNLSTDVVFWALRFPPQPFRLWDPASTRPSPSRWRSRPATAVNGDVYRLGLDVRTSLLNVLREDIRAHRAVITVSAGPARCILTACGSLHP